MVREEYVLFGFALTPYDPHVALFTVHGTAVYVSALQFEGYPWAGRERERERERSYLVSNWVRV